jgi:seryl-tRNA synthetase
MLEIKFVRNNLSEVEKALSERGWTADLKTFKALDDRQKDLIQKNETLKHRRNVVSAQIAQMIKKNENSEFLKDEMRQVSQQIKKYDQSLAKTNNLLQTILSGLPNIPHETVPVGRNEADNPVLKTVGVPPSFPFDPSAHWLIGKALHILDFERAATITGARFPLYFGAGALLERALINFMLDLHTKRHGYKETLPPFIVNRDSMTATGQLPKFEQDLFKLADWDDYYLIPTAEVPVTNIHRNEIIDGDKLPILYTAYTPCFRSEAGSYGKDTKGLIRQHQFNKVELVKFVHPDNSYIELEKLLTDAEEVLVRLDIPYRVVTLCTGDLGFSAEKTYDIEVWMPAQNMYREISSCSNFGDFQARRANIRFRCKEQKGTRLVHTLNGSGLAVGRTVAAVLENYQQEDGTVRVPHALRSYMGKMKVITNET